METLGELLETRDIEFDVVERRIRCIDNHYLMVIAILCFLKVLPTCSQLSVQGSAVRHYTYRVCSRKCWRLCPTSDWPLLNDLRRGNCT
jgi:hypothetical protein